MRGEKDEEKAMSPIFRRLHVNDTKKSGPKAPPRNKMALYEQLSIPSQRHTSGSASLLPLPPDSVSSLVPLPSSSHGGSHERSMFTPLCNSPTPCHLTEKLQSYYSGGVKLNSLMVNHEKKSATLANFQSLNAIGPLSPITTCNPLQPHNFANHMNSSKKFRDEDDFRLPPFTQSGITPHGSGIQQSKDKEKLPPMSPSSSMPLQTASEKQMKGTSAIDVNSRQHVKNQPKEHPKVSQISQDPVERSASIPSTREKISADSSSSPSTTDKNSGPLKRACAPLNKEDRTNAGDGLKLNKAARAHDNNAQLHQERAALQDNRAPRHDSMVEPAKGINKGNASKVRSELCSRPSVGDDNRSPRGLENGCDNRLNKVDYTSTLDISPDDVVGIIGEKQFWKARSAIANQQRTFTVQVFELHRLIKVQRLIAGSPHLLFDDNLYLGKSSSKASSVKKLPSENVIEPPPLIANLRETCQKPNASIECTNKSAVVKLPLPSDDNDTRKGPFILKENYGIYSSSAPPASMATNSKSSPWCSHPPPENKWLVPVMSPSEGLVYKPYTGPCPPTAGFMAPVYASCGSMSLTPGNGDFLNSAYGVILPGTPHLGQTYFPPYGMPIMNPSISGSAIEQIYPFAGSQSDEPLCQSSCNMSSQMSLCCAGKPPQAFKESELQCSTASGPSEKARGDALPLFPMAPTAQATDINGQNNSSENPTRVIKVVPHNPRSATESAARIFRSIQEERKLVD